jgi:hypothetical protein
MEKPDKRKNQITQQIRTNLNSNLLERCQHISLMIHVIINDKAIIMKIDSGYHNSVISMGFYQGMGQSPLLPL